MKYNQLLKNSVFVILTGVLSYSIFMTVSILRLDKEVPFTSSEVKELLTRYTDPKTTVEDIRLNNDFPVGENRIIVSKLGLDIGILEGDSDVLEDGLWHRYPDRGDPFNDGNFVLAGHRFNVGLTPTLTRRASPLYNIDKLLLDDEITVIWEGQIFNYVISEILTVKPTDIQIEDKTDTAILTLYTCTLEGESDGRVVIRAQQVL